MNHRESKNPPRRLSKHRNQREQPAQAAPSGTLQLEQTRPGALFEQNDNPPDPPRRLSLMSCTHGKPPGRLQLIVNHSPKASWAALVKTTTTFEGRLGGFQCAKLRRRGRLGGFRRMTVIDQRRLGGLGRMRRYDPKTSVTKKSTSVGHSHQVASQLDSRLHTQCELSGPPRLAVPWLLSRLK